MKRIFLPIVFLFITHLSFAQICNKSQLPFNLQNGLVGYYPFCGNANDLSGNGNNGIVNGATLTTDRFGNTNSAYNFNGTSNYITIANVASNTFTSTFSISVWVKPAAGYGSGSSPNGNQNQVVSKWGYGGVNNAAYSLGVDQTGVAFTGVHNGSASSSAYSTPTTLPINNWHHLVSTLSGGVLKLYVNNILVKTIANSVNAQSSRYTLDIAREALGNYGYFKGVIDDIQLYNRALNACEVSQIYTSTNTDFATPSILTFNPFPAQSSTCGVSKVLDAGAGYTSYLWNTGATSQTISPTINGEYRVTVTNAAGCSASDTVSISLIKSDIIQANQTVCANTTLNLFIDSTFSGSVINVKSQMSANLQTGLVAYYPFNGNATDISGNNNVLTANGVTLTTDRFGRSNSAYSFTNTQTSVTNYLKAVNPTPFAKNTYTISAWFNSRQFYPNIGGVTYNYQSIVFYSPQWYNYGPAYHLALQHANNSILEGGNWTSANTNQGVTTANGSIVVNQWYHVVLSYDGTTIKMYKDGQLVGSRAATISYANQIQFLIGGAGDGPSPGGIYGGFNGKIDDVGFWDRALTFNEVQELYNGRPSVLWSTSETSNKISVTPTVTTKYYATLTDGIATCIDSVTITVDNIAGFNPLQDTIKLCGDSLVLDAGAGFASYNWSNGATTSAITAKSSGRYIATVTNSSGCSASDTSFVSIVKAKILQRDTTICLGNSITLAIDSSGLNKSSVCLKSNLPVQLQNGLIAYYPFCGNANDGSGNGINGILFGTPTLVADRFGNSNSAYNFNGSNQYIQTASISEPITNKTISAWVKLSSLSQMGGGLAAVQSSNGSIFDAVVYNETNSGWGFGSDNLTRTKWSGVKEAASEWVMLTATYENNSYKLYRNGVLISSTTQFPITSFGTTSKFNIGLRHNNGGTPYLNGVIDDVYFYNKALSSSEILSLYNATAVSWSTGVNTNSITVSPITTTKYFVSVSDGITTCNDSIIVTVSDIGTFNPLQDTVKVCGDSIVLDAGPGYSTYTWSNGATTRTITAKASGKYFVNVANASGCTASDTSLVSIVKAKILQRDTTICKGNSMTLSIDSSLLNLSIYKSVNLSSQANFNICSLGGFSTISSGTSLFGGVPFTILPCNGLNSWNSSIGGGANPRKLKLLLNNHNVETLELLSNTYWGQSGPVAYNNVSFWSGGVKVYNKDLIGNVDTRDFLQNSWTNNINNTTTINVKNFTTTSPVSRLDKIKVSLPTPNYVDSIIITDIGDTLFHRLFVYGATVKTKKHTVLWSNGDTTTSISVTPTTTTKYYVTVSDGVTSCMDSVTITVSEIGTFNPLQDTVKVCGDSILLDAGAGYASYSWSNGATTRTITANASGKYIVTVSNAIGCSASDTSVLSIINANILQSDTTICKGSNLTLSILSLKPGQTALWSTGATTPSITVNPTVKTTYTVTVTDGINTCTDSVVVDVSSSELKVTDPSDVCSPGVVNLTAAAITSGSATGLTYTYWKDANATQALANPDKVSVSGTYYIVGTSSTGCTSAPTAVKVTVNPLPVATIIAPTQTAICDKSSITLTARGGTSYQWLLNGSAIAGATDSTYAASQAGSYEVNVIALGCTSKVAAPVNLTLIKAAVPKFSNSSTCIDVPVSFFNETDTTLSGSVNWLWDFGDGQTSTLLNPIYTYKKSGGYIVKLTVTPKLCSSLPVSFTKNITVDIPPLGIKYPNVLAVKNKATPLSARFIANGYTYLWMPSTGLNNAAIQKPVFNFSLEQLYRVRLTSAGGCITMDTVKVSVYDSSDIFVPKAFTPNKDGKNDLLQPFLVNITTLKFFRVYNRWGQLMFQSSDSKQGWDGMYNYKPQPLETYTWIAEGIDGNGTTIFRKGQTVLIR
jgi:gliding motility-associated-like protein